MNATREGTPQFERLNAVRPGKCQGPMMKKIASGSQLGLHKGHKGGTKSPDRRVHQRPERPFGLSARCGEFLRDFDA